MTRADVIALGMIAAGVVCALLFAYAGFDYFDVPVLPLLIVVILIADGVIVRAKGDLVLFQIAGLTSQPLPLQRLLKIDALVLGVLFAAASLLGGSLIAGMWGVVGALAWLGAGMSRFNRKI